MQTGRKESRLDSTRIEPIGVQEIQRGPLREQIRLQIKQLILTNRLRPGQPIVIDRLTSELGVSHTPVREALAMLQHDGLVITRPYGHPLVTEIHASDVRDVWEMRMLLEGWAARKAAVALSDTDLGTMAESLACARRDARQSQYDSHRESDNIMHEMIVQAGGNLLFDRLAETVTDRSTRIRWLVETMAPVEQVLTMVDEHCAILDALQARDPEMAQERLMAHLQAGMDRTLNALDGMRETQD
jgi:DNA-binding GntR family transcriptional regulator